jgi:YVTN family beta-propeller protein
VRSDADDRRGIRFCVLGPLQVLRDGAQLRIGGAQQRAVLAFLLVERDRVVSVDQIVEALWADRPQAGHTATIQTYVYHLREVLEPDRAKGEPPRVLITEPGGYRLNINPDTIDETEFERLIESGERLLAQGSTAESVTELGRALSLWRGSVLADLASFDFVARLGGRLDELRWRAIESKIDAQLALGQHVSMLAELNSFVESQPLREHLQAQRILALYRAGRQADALSAFRSVRALLRAELGIEPGVELTNLHQAILNQDAALLLAQRNPPKRAASAAAPPDEPAMRPRTRRPPRRPIATAVVSVLMLTVAAFVVGSSGSSSPSSLPANSLVRIDADGSFHDPVAMGASPDAVAVVGNVAWVANTGAGSVSKIDLERHVIVQTTPVGLAPQALAVLGSDLWVVNSGEASVSRLSLKTDQVVETISVGNLPAAIAADTSGVWVVDTGDDTVVRIDPVTGNPDAPIAVGFRPAGIAVAANTIWVSNSGDGTVSPIDATSHVVGSSIAVGAGPAAIAVSHGAVWVANSSGQTASRISAGTRQVVAAVQVGDGPKSITLVGNRLWVANESNGDITVVDPASGHAVTHIATGAVVRGLAGHGSSAYATTRSLVAAGHRGGTLHITADQLPNAEGIDPSRADAAYVFSAYSLAYDGLVGLQRTGGGAGLTLVPDLALDLPRPSADGLSYTFRLRRGIHYSNGREVKPADFRLGLQQQLTVGGDEERFANIVGAPECIRRKTVCDLTEGVLINDDAFEVTFTLSAPDPDFLYKLTEPLFATPEGHAGEPATTPRPATGPYMFGEYRSATRFTLVRNPYFHPWSSAAQPEGFPNVIEWTVDPDPTRAVHNVLAGIVDADERAPAAADYANLRRTHPDQFRRDFTARTVFLFLNTHIAPFDNPDVRQAINFAVDRNELVELLGGASSATPTCQILPPNFPGYRRYCPYTAQPAADGGYHGPDFATASALVNRSHTLGTAVTVVYPFPDPPFVAAASYVARVLTSLGYRATEAPSSDESYFSSQNPAPIGVGIFYMDYPAPANFLGQLRCNSGAPGGYCNPAADRLFTDSVDGERGDRVRAYADWARLDRVLTDDAAWLPLYNSRSTVVLSDRVRNYESNPKIGPLYSQMWIAN